MFDNQNKNKQIKNIKVNEQQNKNNNEIKKEQNKKIEEHMEEEEEELKEEKKNNNNNSYNLNSENEIELIKVELGKNIVARVLSIDDEKYIDFGKFYKGYPTKKNIRIKYNTYLKLNQILNK